MCPDYVAPESDPRIAADQYEYMRFLCQLAKERPDFNEWFIRLVMDAERSTMH